MIDDRFRGAREAAVEVAIVRREDDPVVADDIDDVDEYERAVGVVRTATIKG